MPKTTITCAMLHVCDAEFDDLLIGDLLDIKEGA